MPRIVAFRLAKVALIRGAKGDNATVTDVRSSQTNCWHYLKCPVEYRYGVANAWLLSISPLMNRVQRVNSSQLARKLQNR